MIVEAARKKKLQTYDKLLKSFQYGKALDATLEKPFNPVSIVSMLEELVHRNGVRIALAGRDEEAVIPLLEFLAKYITHPRYSKILLTVTNIVIGTCCSCRYLCRGAIAVASHEYARAQDQGQSRCRA